MKKLLWLIIVLLFSLPCTAQSCFASFEFFSPWHNQIFFMDDSEGNPTDWYWDFGDGDTSILSSETHTYASEGVYLVCLTITDSVSNCTDTYCDYVYSLDTSTCYGWIYHFPDTIPNTVKFSEAPINSPYYPIDWLWDFGDNTTSTLRNPSHTFVPGDYYVCLKSNDSLNTCYWEDCDSVHIGTPSNEVFSVCNNGNWSNPNTWSTGAVPNPTDSVLIYHDIILDTNVTLVTPGLLYIDEAGSLCGHNSFTGRIITYGPLSADYITINGLKSYSDFVLITYLYTLSIDGNWTTQYFPSGGNFTCNPPNPCGTGISEYKLMQTISVYPNPTTGKFTVAGATAEIQVFDLFGRLVLRTNKEQIDMSSYPAGIYIWQVGNQRGKLVLE